MRKTLYQPPELTTSVRLLEELFQRYFLMFLNPASKVFVKGPQYAVSFPKLSLGFCKIVTFTVKESNWLLNTLKVLVDVILTVNWESVLKTLPLLLTSIHLYEQYRLDAFKTNPYSQSLASWA